jgi:MYXO-CTERM domain-containing protein
VPLRELIPLVSLVLALAATPVHAEVRWISHDLRSGETWSGVTTADDTGPVLQRAGEEGARGNFGADDAVEVKDPSIFPYSTACRLSFRFNGGGGNYSCSGTLIGPHHVLTAGHCVYQSEEGGWIEEMTASPGYDHGAEPFGAAEVVRVHALEEWMWDESSLYDMALLGLDRDVGTFAGYLGYESYEDPDQYVGPLFDCNHYPSSPIGDAHTQFHSHDEVIHADEWVLGHYLDTAPGSSGGGLYRDDGDEGFLVGVNSSHWSGYNNIAPRINPERLAWLEEHFADDPVPENLPDLVPGACLPGAETVEQGQELTLTIKVLNWGTAAAPDADVAFHASLDHYITHNDPELGRTTVGPAEPYDSASVQVTITVPEDFPPDIYNVGYILDPDDVVDEVGGTNFAGDCEGVLLILPSQAGDDDDDGDDDAVDDDEDGEGCQCTAAGSPVTTPSWLAPAALALLALLRRR